MVYISGELCIWCLQWGLKGLNSPLNTKAKHKEARHYREGAPARLQK